MDKDFDLTAARAAREVAFKEYAAAADVAFNTLESAEAAYRVATHASDNKDPNVDAFISNYKAAYNVACAAARVSDKAWYAAGDAYAVEAEVLHKISEATENYRNTYNKTFNAYTKEL